MKALQREAKAEASRLPPLLAEARRLAATVRAGAHFRKQGGIGEGFWSYRPYRPGDEPRLIDWRRSARGDEVLVRETEQVRAATVLVWPDRRPGMRWRSSHAWPTKADRAVLLALALADLLGRGGERCGLLTNGVRPGTGSATSDRFAEALMVASEDVEPQPAPAGVFPIWMSDALESAPLWKSRFDRAGGQGVLLRITDPAEADFPYAGRVAFAAPAGGVERLIGRAERLRAEYVAARGTHMVDLELQAARSGVRVLDHRTDRPAAAALLALWRSISGAA